MLVRWIKEEPYIQKHTIYLANFFNSERESNNARADLLNLYREYQLWASDDVFQCFKHLLTTVTDKKSLQEQRNLLYKKFVLKMRKDLLGKNTKIGIEDIEIRSIVN